MFMSDDTTLPSLPHLALITDLARLYAYDNEGNDELAFALTLSTGWVKDKQSFQTLNETDWGNLQNWFLPWLWRQQLNGPRDSANPDSIPGVRLWVGKEADDAFEWHTVSEVSMWLPPRGFHDYPTDRDSLQRHYENFFKHSLRGSDANPKPIDEEALIWRTPFQKIPNDETDIELPENMFHLPSQLARFSCALPPLNHLLNLACCFTIRGTSLPPDALRSDNNWYFLALPIFPGKFIIPDDGMPMKWNTLWNCRYQGSGPRRSDNHDTEVIGYCNPAPVRYPVPSRGTVIDLNDLTINLNGSERLHSNVPGGEKANWLADDWFVRLENNTASLFDLSQRILDACRPDVKPFDVRLILLRDQNDIPNEASERLIVARFRNDKVRFRVFDASGTQVLDKSEDELAGKNPQIEDLKTELEPLWGHVLTAEQQASIRGQVAFITEHTFTSEGPAANIIKWVLAASRDIAGLGIRFRPDGDSLLADEFRGELEWEEAANSWEKARFGEAADWLHWLQYAPDSPAPSWDTSRFTIYPLSRDRENARTDLDSILTGNMTEDHLNTCERFLEELRSPETLRNIVLTQWEAFLSYLDTGYLWDEDSDKNKEKKKCFSESTAPKILDSIKLKLKNANNPSISLARSLIGGTPGPSPWRNIVRATFDSNVVDRIREGLRDTFINYIDHRDKSIRSSASGVENVIDWPEFYPELSEELNIKDAVLQIVIKEAERIVPRIEKVARVEESPHAITLQVDQPDHATAIPQGNDLLSKMAGCIVMARRILQLDVITINSDQDLPQEGRSSLVIAKRAAGKRLYRTFDQDGNKKDRTETNRDRIQDLKRLLDSGFSDLVQRQRILLTAAEVLDFKPGDIDSAATWRHLNYAMVWPVSLDEPFKALYLIPNQLGYIDGMRQTTLTYDNQPLAARSPGAGLFEESAKRIHEKENRLADVSRLDFLPATNENLVEARIPGLFYSGDYEFAAFPVLNSGVLHPALSAAHPAFPKKIDDIQQDSFEKNKIMVSYRRRVGVGEPRLRRLAYDREHDDVHEGPTQRKAAALKFPEIPESVRPLAWELLDQTRNAAGNNNDLEAGSPRPPLLMLLPGERFPIHLRKPCTNLENWNRWVAADPTDETRNRRIQEIALSAEHAEQGEQADISLDDPALANELWVQAECLFPPNTDGLSGRTSDWKKDDRRRASVEFCFEALKESVGAGRVDDSDGDHRITGFRFPKGSVWRILLFPMMRCDTFRSHFDENAFPKRSVDASSPVLTEQWQLWDNKLPEGVPEGHLLFRPFELLVEVPTDERPTADELWDRLRPSVHGDRVSLSVDLIGEDEEAKETDRKLAFISRVEVRHQIWNWTGWQIREFPFQIAFSETPDGDENNENMELVNWDAIGFHDRADWQYATSGATIGWRNDAQPGPLATLFQASHAGDPRAFYYRFSVVVHSRYEGLMNLFAGRDSFVVASRPLNEDVKDPWRRCALPARPAEKLQPPSIHMIVPLTKRYEYCEGITPSPKGSPGVLIVLREPWYAQAGLAEQLELEVGTKEHWKSILSWESWAEFDLLLIKSTDAVPETGRSTICVALRSGEQLMFKVFGDDERIIADATLSTKLRQIGHLKTRLDQIHWSRDQLTDVDKVAIINEVRDILGSERYWAGGFDPITSPQALDTPQQSIRTHHTFRTGPFGFTMDLNAPSPLLTHSAYVFNELPGDLFSSHDSNPEQKVPGWFFSQIRLRRVLAKWSLGLSEQEKNGNDGDQTPKPEDVWASQWTAPEWVQFLPDANGILPDHWKTKGGDGAVQITKSGTEYTLAGWKEPTNPEIAWERFDHWILIIAPVLDVRGHSQERYAAILGQTTDGHANKAFSVIDGNMPESGRLYCRVMQLRLASMGKQGAEVRSAFRSEVRSLQGKQSSPFTLLFGEKENNQERIREDAWAQIVLVSDRLDAIIAVPQST
jgi:hypothetical protein